MNGDFEVLPSKLGKPQGSARQDQYAISHPLPQVLIVFAVADLPLLFVFAKEIVTHSGEGLSIETVTSEKHSPLARELGDLFVGESHLLTQKFDGGVFAEKFRTIAPEIPIIVLTGYAYNKTIKRLRLLNHITMLTKPIKMSELAETLAKVLKPKSIYYSLNA